MYVVLLFIYVFVVLSQKAITAANKRKSSDGRLPPCRADNRVVPGNELAASYRCVFLTEAQSSSVGRLSSKCRDLADDEMLSPYSCSPRRTPHTGTTTCCDASISLCQNVKNIK